VFLPFSYNKIEGKKNIPESPFETIYDEMTEHFQGSVEHFQRKIEHFQEHMELMYPASLNLLKCVV